MTLCKRFHMMALAGILATSFCVLWLMACWLGSIMYEFYLQEYRADSLVPSRRSLVILSDGTPLLQSWEPGEASDENDNAHVAFADAESRHAVYHTLQGVPVKPAKVERAEFARFWSGRPWKTEPKSKWQWRVSVRWVGRDPNYSIAWFLVQKGVNQAAYFVGYDEETNRPIGYIGAKGFSLECPSEEDRFNIYRSVDSHTGSRFDLDFSEIFGNRNVSIVHGDSEMELWKSGKAFFPWVSYCVVDNGLLRVDVKQQTATLVVEHPHPIDATAAVRMLPESNIEEPRQARSSKVRVWGMLVFRTEESIMVLDCNGNVLDTYMLPEKLREASLDFLQLPDRQALICTPHIYANETNLYWIGPDGAIARHEHIDLRDQGPSGSGLWGKVLSSCMAPCPALVGAGIVGDACSDASEETTTSSERLQKAWNEYWPFTIIPSLCGIVLAVVCYRRQRKFALPGTWMWTIFVLLFGLPGYLGYRFHRSWPARLPCPSCGRRVPRDRIACCECSAPFPAPVPTGTEVLA